MAINPVVINEWIFHFIAGEDGREAQERARVYLEELRRSDDQILVLAPSRWMDKAWSLWKVDDPRVEILSKFLFLGILIDPLKRQYFRPDELCPLPEELARQVPPDDAYLFQLALSGAARVIVTSDRRLIAMVGDPKTFNIQLALPEDYWPV